MTQSNSPHIVVLGAGFGGLTFCKQFNHPPARITLVDRQNHHLFQPLLYQVATAGLAMPDIAQPIRSILSDRANVTVLLDNVLDIQLVKKRVILEKNILSYDYLVLALGGVVSYFGHPEWERYAPGLKSLEDAMLIRRQILLAFEKAENEVDPLLRDLLMTIIVVGGGPTGVELAGAFAELANHVLKKDFRRIDPSKAKVILIEASPGILSNFPRELAASAENQLSALGVDIRTSTKVKDIRDRSMELDDGRVIQAENIIWAAGVSANPITKNLGVEIDRTGRVKVMRDLSVPGHPEVFAVGDIALVLGEEGQPVPGVSPAAMQMAKHVARIIEDEVSAAKPGSAYRPPFRYWDKGIMATIGRSAAVAKIGRLEFSGFMAWLAWLFIHLIFLVGFRNKISVFLLWVYSYVTYKRGARIVAGISTGQSPAATTAAQELPVQDSKPALSPPDVQTVH